MKIKPKLSFKLLGTSIQISKHKIYEASYATNQPKWKEKEKVFCEEILLERNDYQIIEP
jgi:hypothetical protein